MRVLAVALIMGFCAVSPVKAQMPLPAVAPPDPATLFGRQCGTCHVAVADGGVRQGPNLWGVYGRKAGSLPDFKYSANYASSGIVWDETTMDSYLTNPQAMIAGSVMGYRQANPEVRATIIGWLKEQH